MNRRLHVPVLTLMASVLLVMLPLPAAAQTSGVERMKKAGWVCEDFGELGFHCWHQSIFELDGDGPIAVPARVFMVADRGVETSRGGGGELDDRNAVGWGKVLRAIDEAQQCSGLTSVAVTKILHRKRPHLVPINDSLLRDFYGVKHARYSAFFHEVHRDLNESREQLDKWVLPYSEGRPAMTRLRCLDIVIWMHQRSGT